jgi:hypothetical protein
VPTRLQMSRRCELYRDVAVGKSGRQCSLKNRWAAVGQLQPFERHLKIHRNRPLVPPGAGASLSDEDWTTMVAKMPLKRPLHASVEWQGRPKRFRMYDPIKNLSPEQALEVVMCLSEK